MAQAPEGKSDRVYQCHPGDAVSKGAEVSDFLSCGRQQAISCRKTAQGSSSLYQEEGGGTVSLLLLVGHTCKATAVSYSVSFSCVEGGLCSLWHCSEALAWI